MAEYKGIFGTKIQNYTSDPDNPITGQVWYNESSQTMKFQYPTTVSAWSTGGSLTTNRYQVGSNGPQTDALAYGGNLVPGESAANELYNGTSWTELADLNTARRLSEGAGVSSTSALNFGGYNGTAPTGLTESWNGSSWTEVNDMGTGRYRFGGG